MSELVWIAVPGGLVPPGQVLIRVLVVPHLRAGVLSNYDELIDWPQTLRHATFVVRAKSGERIWGTSQDPTYRPAARSEVWQAFFDGPAGTIEDRYEQSERVRAGADPGVRRRRVAETYTHASRVEGTYRRATVDVARPDADPEVVIRREIGTWDTPQAEPARRPAQRPLPPLPAEPEFHRAVTMLREHPDVMRELGLIFELTVAAADLAAGDEHDRYLRVGLRGPAGSLAIRSPWTKYELTETGFWAAPADTSRFRVRDGMLDLEGAGRVRPLSAEPDGPRPPWAVTTVDVDGAASGLRAAAKALRTDEDTHPPVMPAARSAGLNLIRPDRQLDFDERAAVAVARARATPDTADLTAEDLILGYRVDIRTGDGPWRSLCEREVEYTVRNPTTGETFNLGGDGRHREEGHVKPHAAVTKADDELRADEIVVRWDGWSLALPRINLVGNTRGSTRTAGTGLPYEFDWRYHIPPGRLPKLRFAGSYQMRVRLVDIAGGGPQLDEDELGGTGASDTIRYARHEPVQPPELTGDAPFAPGAAVDRLVIRSDHDLSVAELHAAEPGYPDVEQRTLHPPQASFALAEQHGAFNRPVSDEQTWQWARQALLAGAGEDVLPDPAARGVNAYLPSMANMPATSRRAGWPPWPQHATKHIVLTAASAMDPPVSLAPWTGDGTRLEVKLAKAHEATIELSSTIQDGYLDHFPAFGWLSEAGVTSSETQNGRNPLLSPRRLVHLVHAVRKPLVDPVWTLPDEEEVAQSEGATTATVKPTFDDEGLDVNSTGRLELSARWTEWSDRGPEPASVDYLHGETIYRDDPTPTLKFQHELGDTKHRNVIYTLAAISRFRHYFEAAEPDEAFQVRLDQPVVNLRSTARPSAPDVLATTPAFHWQTHATASRIERVRSPRIRVELARPWYETGEGEMLAVIVARTASPADEIADLVTQAGRDPIVASEAVPQYPAVSWFTGFVGRPANEKPPGIDTKVTVLPYRVTDAGDCWHADIEVSRPAAASSYAPFVRLAVARYQPDSLEGLSLSPVVRCEDTIQLLPERRLAVVRDGTQLQVTLAGTGPNPPNRVEAVLERPYWNGVTLLELRDSPAGLSPDATDLVALSPMDTNDVPAWRTVTGRAVVGPQGATLSVPLPSDHGPLRLRIREVEGGDGVADQALPPELQERTVFLDTIRVPEPWLER